MQLTIKKWLSELSVKLVMVSALFIAAVFIFSFIADEVVLEKEDLFDTTVFDFFAARTTPALVHVMQVLTFFGSAKFFIPAYIVLIGYFLITRRTNYAVDIAVVAVSSTVLLFALKQIFHRKRPDFPLIKTLHNYSFPSGHALCSFIFCSVLIYMVQRSHMATGWKWLLSVLLFLFSVSVGISRVVLRYHYASDVVAAFFLGIAWVLFSLWLQRRLTRPK